VLYFSAISNFSFISPSFIVADLQASLSFYTGKLGFEVWHLGPEEDPYFAMIGRGPVSLMLKGNGQPSPNHTRYEWGAWDAYISAPDPDTLYEEYLAAGVVFNQPLKDTTDNLRGFEVADMDGYILFFGRPNT
jgi:catechol 2,3-dioxygenase-like lactoylglutathione lyase family enzyme